MDSVIAMTIWERHYRRLGSSLRWAGPSADTRAFGIELGLAALGGLIYFLIRGGVVDRAAEAFARAGDLVEVERALGVFWEPAMQAWILDSPSLISVFNGVYFWLHMPLILAMAVWLFARHREVYRLTRNAFLGSAVIALVLYATLPVAPPRFFPELGFVDTMALYSEANYQAQEVGLFVNPYAALPSLHFGWALLLGIALWMARPRGQIGRRAILMGSAFAVVGIAIPTGQLFAIVLTGNHFLIDAWAGGIVAGLGLAGAVVWRRRREAGRGTSAGDGLGEDAMAEAVREGVAQ